MAVEISSSMVSSGKQPAPSSEPTPSRNTRECTEREDLRLLAATQQSLKVILLGDSAVGKSKLVERFLLDNYRPHQLSTYALTLYQHMYNLPDGGTVPVSIWDTAGQERFNALHASYYYCAHVCILVFDVTRKVTYQHLERWYVELQSQCPGVPTIVVANKIDVDYAVTKKSFAFVEKHNLPFFFVSAADGANVVRVFQTAIVEGLKWRGADKDNLYHDIFNLLSNKRGASTSEQQQEQHPGGAAMTAVCRG